MKVDLFKKAIDIGDNVVYAKGQNNELVKGIITDVEPWDKVIIDNKHMRNPEHVVIVPNETSYLPY